MNRRNFVKSSAMAAAGLSLAGNSSFAETLVKKNPIPRWRGFNLLDFFSPNPASQRIKTTEEHFKWMRDWGFDFVRIPIAYPSYLNIDRTRNITAEEVYKIDERAVDSIQAVAETAMKYNMHVSMNLHRAPGFCINAGFYEPFNLWKDQAAQEAFAFHWNMWAKRFKNVSRKKISFDLVNEPIMKDDMNDQHSPGRAIPGDVYRKVALVALEAIQREKKDALVVADGNNGGNTVIPELKDLPLAQSCRGYNPGSISHYKAPWANKDPEKSPTPVWPGEMNGKYYSRQTLEDFYKPWIQLVNEGVGVHCGECGCWNKTPHDVFLAWFSDVLDILKTNNIGFGLWEFVGTFGILDSGRTDVQYEDWYGHKLDRKLLNLLMKS